MNWTSWFNGDYHAGLVVSISARDSTKAYASMIQAFGWPVAWCDGLDDQEDIMASVNANDVVVLTDGLFNCDHYYSGVGGSGAFCLPILKPVILEGQPDTVLVGKFGSTSMGNIINVGDFDDLTPHILSNVTVRGMKIDVTQTNGGGPGLMASVNGSRLNNIVFEDLEITGNSVTSTGGVDAEVGNYGADVAVNGVT